jgi:hypothetical protein
LVRCSHPSGKGDSTKGGSVTKPTAFVPRQPRDRASRPDKFLRTESKNHGFRTKFQQAFLENIFLSGP